MASNRPVVVALRDNVNGLVCLVGAIWLYVGLRGFSPALANVVAGALLVTIGAWPYLRRTYLGRRD